MKQLSTFILTLALWFIFVGQINIEVFLLGTIICSIVSLTLTDNVPRSVQLKYGTKKFSLRIYYIFLLFSNYISDVFLSAFRVSKQAFKLKPSFSTSIAASKTSLKNKSRTEILVYFITLPKMGLGIDIDVINRDYSIHWIDIHNDDKAKEKHALIHKHENLIAKIFVSFK
ncbi:putative monovalent cation/H+ antiporter subunit E [Paraliobacillus sp. PM-2]|uniref:Na+/H+ antiporter subunit E n=1 Tax=Paraliobacillus sp. PM-2 TaxID=1462524 RepID=UPI00061BFB98|nr:Na+/H+ antiporter subunit E [Paraliobacillus sp. PM-2]CQR48034.1 putative monovalent cation/H+ antiporter subunit E [Paraliobacillus sp. PM-2]